MAEASQKLSMFWFLTISIVATLLVSPASGQLSTGFYSRTCPSVLSTVRSTMTSAVRSDGRVGASLLRMHFHDCFVQGCEASVLLDDVPSAGLIGEKNVGANAGSLRGFQVIDNIKSALENQCPGTVSCADILAIAARDGVNLAGGPSWNVELGRRDGISANAAAVGTNLPGPGSSAGQIIAQFGAQGLDTTDVVALSGGHTFGKSQCFQFSGRLFNFANTGAPDPSIDPALLGRLQAACPQGGNGAALVDFDQATPGQFDSSYYNNLLINRGLLTSDQTLQNSGQTTNTVTAFTDQNTFFSQFSRSMIKMGRIGVLTGSAGQIRTNCRRVNSG
ncbi:peroxidase [Marchantia polymorpha subsp. ruderalis]|uniref:Peroxidase n=2 Tax=Marchantia polymorpha TaxID=3197 RepID=A0A176W6Y1_MARPO|nr:hypothetical protein AXG93_2334s1100 [Marchantia polymorpha subsp. ruderalis]PTQ48876.1 hypothetical protein MARPO_0004s0139 [Marchantia polymorpha]BBN05705.1 hypothetical protein Mp_3g15330 [Marchantia polymorpha subsp. ruderalis]|eukprot:PTQ48876.1 hypothetical protein MARPO_0004s0139 [Marchantia polymorpha]